MGRQTSPPPESFRRGILVALIFLSVSGGVGRALGSGPRQPIVRDASEPATAAAGQRSDVIATLIDGSTTSGRWGGSADGRVIELLTASGPKVCRVDDMMSLSFGLVHRRQRHCGTDHSDPSRALEKAVRNRTRAGTPEGGRVDGEEDKKSRADSTPSFVTFHLADGGRLCGEVTGAGTDAIIATTSLGEGITLPFDRLAGVRFASSQPHARAAEAFSKALSSRLPGQDALVSWSGEDAKTLRGRLERIDPTGGSFSFGQRTRDFRLDRVFGIVFATGTARPLDAPVTIELADGSVFSGRFIKADTTTLMFATSLGVDAVLPVAGVSRLDFRSPRVVYLSDLSPSAERGEGRLHRPWPMRRDENVAAGPISLGGKRFKKGLGVHSRCELDYEIGGGYEAFVADIGIDDAVGSRGSVVFRVLGDGALLYESQVMTGESEPRKCRVDISGVGLLTLAVDYGDGLDLADHANWAAARLLRASTDGSSPRPRGGR